MTPVTLDSHNMF